jgi:hypothetical protein
MGNFYFIGVDVSKKKLDFCVMFEGKVLHEEQISNHQGAVAGLIGELKKDLEMDNEQFLICAEHTGQYTFRWHVPASRSSAACGWKIRPR